MATRKKKADTESTPPPEIKVMKPPALRCQEASPLSHNFYISCGAPSAYVVKNSDPKAYCMCEACADHNVKNRGARIVMESEKVEIWEGPPPSETKIIPKEEAPTQPLVHVAGAKRVDDVLMQPMQSLHRIHDAGRPADAALQQLVTETQKVLAEARERGDRSADLIQIYARIVTANDILSAQLKAFGDIISLMKGKLIPEAFERDGVQTLTSRDGDRVTVTQKLFASLNAANREKAYSWLRENGHGAMIVETVNASSLSAFAKAELAEGREIPEDIFTVHMAPSVTLTRKK